MLWSDKAELLTTILLRLNPAHACPHAVGSSVATVAEMRPYGGAHHRSHQGFHDGSDGDTIVVIKTTPSK